MANLSTKHVARNKIILVYGPPKTGKSLFVGKLAEKKKLLWFDLENGSDVLFSLPKEWHKNIELIKIPDNRSYPIAIETCLKVIKGGAFSICETHGKVSCPVCIDLKTKLPKDGASVYSGDLSNIDSDTVVVFDSLTQLTNSAISSITRNKPDDYKLNYDDWGNLGKLLDIFLSHVQTFHGSIVCISHEGSVEMQDGKEKIVPVAGTRNFSRNTARYFGEVIYTEVVNKKHIAASSTTYKNSILTGSRTGASFESEESPKLLSIFEEH